MEHFYQNIQGWFTYPILYSTVVNTCSDNAHFVEIGSWKGQSSAFMAVCISNSNKNIKFDCIDTWQGSEEHALQPQFYDDLYREFLNNISSVSQYIRPLRMASTAAAKIYKDGSLDFVFIDAAHDYDNVKADINAWYPKVKLGGIIAGHDYNSEHFPGTKKAVDEFFTGKNLLMNQSELTWLYYKI